MKNLDRIIKLKNLRNELNEKIKYLTNYQEHNTLLVVAFNPRASNNVTIRTEEYPQLTDKLVEETLNYFVTLRDHMDDTLLEAEKLLGGLPDE